MKKFIFLLSSILLNSVMGIAFGACVGLDPGVSALGMNGIAAVASMLPQEAGVARATVYRELWTGEMVKALRSGLEGAWLGVIEDASALVNNEVIHLVDVGVDPDVLINNTSYPIAVQELADGDITISLDKFQTKATPITDDELYALSYDKMKRVKESHADALADAERRKAAHAFCAAQNTAKTPVIRTSGEADPATGRRSLTVADLISAKIAMDRLGVPAQGRYLVLCHDHVADLLNASEAFAKQYNLDMVNGRCGRLAGFDIFEENDTPLYTAAGEKKAVGATADAGEFQCSFAFYGRRAFKASGSMKMYWSPAEQDPLNQRNLVNFRHYFIALPKKNDAGVTIMSAYVAPAQG